MFIFFSPVENAGGLRDEIRLFKSAGKIFIVQGGVTCWNKSRLCSRKQ